MKFLLTRIEVFVGEEDRCSSKLDVTVGVPQESASEPLLILPLTNRLLSALKLPRYFPTDDVKVLGSTGSADLSSDILIVLDWDDKKEWLLKGNKVIYYHEVQKVSYNHLVRECLL